MNTYFEDFLNNKLWIYITRDTLNLVDKLGEMLSIKDMNYETISKFLGGGPCIWLRYDECFHYTRQYPRTSTARTISPEIYDYGEIVDIREIMNIKNIEIVEDELISLFK